MGIEHMFGAFMRDLFVERNAVIDTKGNELAAQDIDVAVQNALAGAVGPTQFYTHARDAYLWNFALPAAFAVYPTDKEPPIRIMKSRKWYRRRNKARAHYLQARDCEIDRLMANEASKEDQHA